MKRSAIIFIVLATVATALVAQSLKKTEKINSEQVPISIRDSFENDFGKIPDGYWAATFTVEHTGPRSIAKPLYYSFHKRTKTEKIEVRYTADGKLDYSKGLEKKVNGNT